MYLLARGGVACGTVRLRAPGWAGDLNIYVGEKCGLTELLELTRPVSEQCLDLMNGCVK